MIEIDNLSFAYGKKKVLDKVNLKIENGEIVLLTGKSGSGKTTLVRCLNKIIPKFYDGKLSGTVKVGGKVSMLFQDPERMFVTSDVESEIAFSGGDITDILKTMGLDGLRKRNLTELSGGEKQKVALASVLVTKPDILILDEPLSELDHESADRLLKFLGTLGVTIILIEQRTERVRKYVKREIILDKGKVIYDGKPKAVARPKKVRSNKTGKTLVSFDGQEFKEGELCVLHGPNGSGKTTLLKLIMGFLKPKKGKVLIEGKLSVLEENVGRMGYVFQNPNNHLFAETVEEEVNFILENTGIWGDVDAILKQFDLLHYKDEFPLYLSGGEKQRVALASILVAKPKILLLDEPTRGMDHDLKKELGEFLLDYVKQGNLVIMATHDDYMASFGTRRLEL